MKTDEERSKIAQIDLAINQEVLLYVFKDSVMIVCKMF